MPGWEDTVFPVGLIRSGNSTTERPSQHGCCRGTSSGHGLFDFARWERGDGSLLAGRFRTGVWCAADLLRAKSSTLVDLPSPRSLFVSLVGGAGQTSSGRNLQRSSSSRQRRGSARYPVTECGSRGVERKLDCVNHSGAPSRTFATTSAQDSRFPSELARLRALAISASVGGRRTSPTVRPLASTSSIGPSLARIFAARSSATATFVMRQSSC